MAVDKMSENFAFFKGTPLTQLFIFAAIFSESHVVKSSAPSPVLVDTRKIFALPFRSRTLRSTRLSSNSKYGIMSYLLMTNASVVAN